MDWVLVNIVRRVPKIGVVLVLCSLIITLILYAGFGWSAVVADDITLDEIKELALDLKNKSDGVVFLSETAAEWAKLNPTKAKTVLEDAYKVATGLEESDAGKVGVSLRLASVWLSPELKAQARHWAGQVMDETRPVGPYLALADAWREVDPTRTAAMALQAARAARTRPDRAQRDMGLRAAAVMLADQDPGQAESLAMAIHTPLIRAWAFDSMARGKADADKTVAMAWFGQALDAGFLVSDPLEKLRVLSELAYEWRRLDEKFSQKLFRDGVRLADEFENPVDRAQAFSVLGMSWGRIDPRKAFELAQMIPVEYPEARLAVYLAAAGQASHDRDFEGLILAAHREATSIKSLFEREKALSRIACLLAENSLDAALEIYGELRPGNRWLRDEVAGAIVKAASGSNVDLAAELAGQVENPELNAELTAMLAAELALTDPERARSLLEKAVTAVQEKQVEIYAPDVIAVLAALDPAKAKTMVSDSWPIPGQVDVWTKIARTYERRGQSVEADKYWSQALTLSDGSKNNDGLRAAELYRTIARAMTDVRPRKADKVYEIACQSVAGWLKRAEKRN